MGKVYSMIKNPFRNYNLEARAHKVISKSKPVAAPRYAVDVEQYEKVLKDHPEIIEESLKKDEELHRNLKNVFVTSEDPPPKIYSGQTSAKPLPVNRQQNEDNDFVFHEPKSIPIGKATLKTVMQFVGMHQNNPKVNTANKIAAEYNLDESKVHNILKYIRLYEVYFPDDRKTKARFAGPSNVRRVQKNSRPLLSDSFTKGNDTK